MWYFHVIPSKFLCPNSNFQNKLSFSVSYCSWSGMRWPIFFHARCVILNMSVYSLVIAWEYSGKRDAQSQNEKEIYFMLSNNKILGKCWCGRHPWIQLAMDCERMVEKRINFILCLGTAYDVSSMESIGNYLVVFVDGKSMPLKKIISQFFALSSGTSTNSYFPLWRAFLFTLCNIYFYLSLHLLL